VRRDNLVSAREYLRLAVDAGDIEASRVLASVLKEESDNEADPRRKQRLLVERFRLLDDAAQKRNVMCLHLAGMCWLTGMTRGTTVSIRKSVDYLVRAARSGSMQSMLELGNVSQPWETGRVDGSVAAVRRM